MATDSSFCSVTSHHSGSNGYATSDTVRHTGNTKTVVSSHKANVSRLVVRQVLTIGSTRRKKLNGLCAAVLLDTVWLVLIWLSQTAVQLRPSSGSVHYLSHSLLVLKLAAQGFYPGTVVGIELTQRLAYAKRAQGQWRREIQEEGNGKVRVH